MHIAVIGPLALGRRRIVCSATCELPLSGRVVHNAVPAVFVVVFVSVGVVVVGPIPSTVVESM